MMVKMKFLAVVTPQSIYQRGLYVDELPNHLNTSIDNITYENNISDSIFVPSNIHPQNNPHI